MNDTTPPPGASGNAPGAPQPERRPLQGFFTWLRDLGITRSDERWFAGVAGGIAAKAGIDPIIVRGVFVVLAILGGPGILLYLAGWLLLPDSTGRIHAEELLRGRASTGVIVTAVILGSILVLPVLIGVFSGFFNGPFAWGWGVLPDWISVTFGILWWAVVVPGLIIWLIVWMSSRSSKGESAQTQAASDQGSRSFAQTNADGGTGFERKAEAWSENFERKSEEWGEKMTQQSRKWEQQAEEHEQRYGLEAGHVVFTLAAALLAAGATAAIGIGESLSGSAVFTAALIAAVAVLGLSMIVAGIRGRYTGWVGFLAFVGVIALIFAPVSGTMPKNSEFVPFGNASIVPSSQGEDRGLVTIAGNSTVDLTYLDRGDQPREIDVWMAAGNIRVLLPESHPTRVQVNVLAGNVRDERLGVGDRRQGGIFMSRIVEANTGGADLSQITKVNVRLLAGNVRVDGDSADDRLESDEERSRERRDAEADRRDAQIERLREQLEELENSR